LSRRYPYEVVFPYSKAAATVGGVVDSIIGFALRTTL
jgi:hypothetical protein